MSRSEGALQSTCSALDVRAPRASSKGLLGAPCPGLRARGLAWGSTLFGFVGRKAQAASGNVVHRLHDAGRVYCRSAGRGPDGSSQTTGGSGPASDPFSHDKHTEAGSGSEPRPPPPPQGAREGSPEQGGHWGPRGPARRGREQGPGGREGTAAPPRKGAPGHKGLRHLPAWRGHRAFTWAGPRL